MRQIGVLEAKTRFSSLLDEIEQGGEPIVITRHGKPVARISAETAPARREPRMTGSELVEHLRAFRASQAPDPELDGMPWETLKTLIRE